MREGMIAEYLEKLLEDWDRMDLSQRRGFRGATRSWAAAARARCGARWSAQWRSGRRLRQVSPRAIRRSDTYDIRHAREDRRLEQYSGNKSASMKRAHSWHPTVLVRK